MRVMILFSKGYEEVEALTVVDYLRRAGITVDIVATQGSLETEGDHGVRIMADKLIEDVDAADYDMIITPGGGPGADLLACDERVIDLIKQQHDKGAYVASICASPIVLDAAGIAKDTEGTMYPAMRDQVQFKKYNGDKLVVNDREQRVITSQGPATAVYFALEIIKELKGEEKMREVAEGLLLNLVHDRVKKGSLDF